MFFFFVFHLSFLFSDVNFVGSLESAQADSQELLEKIGAWDEIGKTGWGDNGEDRIFSTGDDAYDNVMDALSSYTPKIDKKLDLFYKADFDSKYLTFASRKVYAMTTR